MIRSISTLLLVSVQFENHSIEREKRGKKIFLLTLGGSCIMQVGEKKLGRKMLIQIQISSPSFYCYYSTSRRLRTLFLTLLTDCRVQQFCNFPLNIYIFSYKIKRNVQIDADTTPARDCHFYDIIYSFSQFGSLISKIFAANHRRATLPILVTWVFASFG